MMRRGLIRAALHLRLGRLGVFLALLVQLLVGVAPLWLPAVEQTGVQICTADGRIPWDRAFPVAPSDTQKAAKACPLCILSSTSLIVPTEHCWQLFRPGTTDGVLREPHQAVPRSIIAFHHLSPAPPRLS
jgi:hypothetical protein